MKNILKKIKPTKKEEENFKKVVGIFLKKLNSKLKGAEAILGGSGAKNTWLSGNHDIDVFVLFNYKNYAKKSDQLANLLEPKLKQVFPKVSFKRVHGSRDYFQLEFNHFNFEVVPVLKINKAEQAVNITDISPLHAIWVNKWAKKLKDEIRLAKQFARSNNLYGAESHINGFSGYVLEILVVYYGSFELMLKKSLKWKSKVVIDYSKFYENKDVLFELNKSKLNSPIIVVDPVDKLRNASAALSVEKFNLFKKLAAKYLKTKDNSLFQKEKLSLEKLKKEAAKKKNVLVFIKVKPLKGKNDVVGVKLLKSFQFLKKGLENFLVKKSGWEYDGETFFYFVLEKEEIPRQEVRIGPPLKMKDAVKNFKKIHKNAYLENGKIKAKVKVEFYRLNEFLNYLLDKKYIREKISDVEEINIE